MTETTVDFHADLYPAEALERAALAYAALADVAVEARGAYRRARIVARGDIAAEDLRNEFANFVLASCAVGGAVEAPPDP
jgi:hypothetical protein